MGCRVHAWGPQVHFDVGELAGLQKRFQAMKKAGLGIDRKGLASLLARLDPSALRCRASNEHPHTVS